MDRERERILCGVGALATLAAIVWLSAPQDILAVLPPPSVPAEAPGIATVPMVVEAVHTKAPRARRRLASPNAAWASVAHRAERLEQRLARAERGLLEED